MKTLLRALPYGVNNSWCLMPLYRSGTDRFFDGAQGNNALAPAFKAPVIICGLGDPKLAHQPNENIVIEKLVRSVKIYTLTAGRFLI